MHLSGNQVPGLVFQPHHTPPHPTSLHASLDPSANAHQAFTLVPCLGARKTTLRESRPIVYFQVVMVGETDGNEMIEDMRLNISATGA